MPGGLTGPELGARCALGLLAYVAAAVALGVRWPGARRAMFRTGGIVLALGGFAGLGIATLVAGGGALAWLVVWVFTIGYVHANSLLRAWGAIAFVAATSGWAAFVVGGLLLLASKSGRTAASTMG